MLGTFLKLFGVGREPRAKIRPDEEAKPDDASDRKRAALASHVPPKRDAWEGVYVPYGSNGDVSLILDAEIAYADKDGQRTRRRITVKHFAPSPYGGEGDIMISAFCHMRQENRTFLTSRITEFVNASTGEVAPDVPEYLNRLYQASPVCQTLKLLKAVQNEFTVLLFVARADDRVTAKEKAVITLFLMEKKPGIEIDKETLGAALSGVPTQAALKRATKAIIEAGETDAIVKAVERLAVARSRMDDFTGAAVKLVMKLLNGGTTNGAGKSLPKIFADSKAKSSTDKPGKVITGPE